MLRKPVFYLAIILLLALTLRLALALTYESHWGVDGGASLLTVNTVLGDEPTGAGFPKPPLAPGWLLAPFVLLLGPDVGYKVWSALFALLPLFPVYLLTRQYVGAWPAVFATGFAAVDLTWGEMFVTGAHPLAAFALLGMAWWAMGELAERFSVKSALILTFSIGLIPWVNQTTAGIALIVLPAYWLSLCYFQRERRSDSDSVESRPRQSRGRNVWKILPFAFLGGLIALGSLPWYMQVLPGSSILHYQGAWIFPSPWTDSVWIQSLFIAIPLGLFTAQKAPQPRIKALGVVLSALGMLVPWQSYDETVINIFYRSGYLMAVAFYPLMAWVVWKFWLPKLDKRLAFACGAVTACIVLAGFVFIVQRQNEYSVMVTPETAAALEMLRNNDPGVGVATNSFTLSLWVAGLNKVHSPFAFTAPPPPAYVDDYANLRCVLNWVRECDPATAARDLDIKYLLIEERFPYYNQRVPGNYLAPPKQWERTAEADWLELAYSAGTTRLWRVAPSPESALIR